MLQTSVPKTKQTQASAPARSKPEEVFQQEQQAGPEVNVMHHFGRMPVWGNGTGAVVQPKLTINQPNDPFEQEADHMAEQVMRMPETNSSNNPASLRSNQAIQRKCTTCGGELEEEHEDTGETLMRKAIPHTIQRKCAACEATNDEENHTLMRKAAGIGGYEASPSLSNQLNRTKGGGAPLPESTRSVMENAFQTDFSRVRIHTDTQAAEMSRGIQARAFTHGQNIYFNRGEFAPGSGEGKRLLAHELAHTLQKRTDGIIARSPGSPAGGCGLCYGTPKAVGIHAHLYAQAIMRSRYPFLFKEYPFDILKSPTDESGRLDLIEIVNDKEVNIGEIKPDNSEGRKTGETDLVWYTKELEKYGVKVGRLNLSPKGDLRLFPTGSMDVGCVNQDILLNEPVKGVYTYYCTPDYKELIKRCKCRKKSSDEQESQHKEKTVVDQKAIEQTDTTQAVKGKSPDIPSDQPGEEIDATDVAIWGTGAVAVATGLHLAYKKAKTEAEKKIIATTVERLATELSRRGATEIAEKLDSHNITKLGTEAYERTLKEAEEAAQKRLMQEGEEKIAKNLAKKGMKKGAKTAAKSLLKKGAKAIPYLGAVITLIGLGNIADAYAKGAEIRFGIEGGESELAGDTNLDIQGHKPEGGPATDASLTDTKIEIELGEMPETSGSLEITANKVTIQGKIDPGDTEVEVDLKVKIENTTIIYKSIGKIKGGKVLLQGSINIQDSIIEIDLPEDTVIEASDSVMAREIKGVKVKITHAGSSGDLIQLPEKSAPEDPVADAVKPPNYSPEELKIISEITQNEHLRKIYDDVFVAKKSGHVSPEVLERLLAMKDKLAAHPELVQVIIEQTSKGKITDPIKQLIEPLEQLLDGATQKSEEPKETEPTPDQEQQAATSPAAPKSSEPEKVGDGQTGVSESSKDSATPLEYWKLELSAKMVRLSPEQEANPPQSITILHEFILSKRLYKAYIQGTLEAKLRTTSSILYFWEANYKFKPPPGVLLSVEGNMPVQFTDNQIEKILHVKATKPPEKKKKKKKK